MAEFSAGAVMAMLALVEGTVLTLFLRLQAAAASEEDVDEVEETAETALEKARANKRDVADVHRRLDDVSLETDGGTENT